ncbi:hypothetical protein LTR17_012933 [Elasticomyces elasticus]|nr:hypothetical protein LTR17_012933 [Elasticomyces elasticus]
MNAGLSRAIKPALEEAGEEEADADVEPPVVSKTQSEAEKAGKNKTAKVFGENDVDSVIVLKKNGITLTVNTSSPNP